MKNTSRLIHSAIGVATLLALGATRVCIPKLWQDTVTSFATIGGFATIYGVVFSIIETCRARAASELAQAAAENANRKLSNLHGVKNIEECLSCIRNVMNEIEKEGSASVSALSRIIELYTAEFHLKYLDPTSAERTRVATLQSFAAAKAAPLRGRNCVNLKLTLVHMLADLNAATSKKMSEKPA